MSLTQKMAAAHAALKRLTGKPTKAHSSGPAPTPACTAKLDRMQGYCRSDPTAALCGISDLKSGRGHRIKPPADGRFQAYGRVHWFESRTSTMKFLVESDRREAWLPPYRVTLYADDRTGLVPDEVFSVLEVLPDFKLTMLEVAFDFAPDQMNRKFVREQALFGKSRPVASKDGNDYWGTRRGANVSNRTLRKSRVLRVELELRSRFLRQYGIKDPYDFGKLVRILPQRHIYFARFNEKRLVARLRGMCFSSKKVSEILEDVALLEGDAWATLNYVRQEWALKNTRRLLDPLDTNDVVVDALTKWAAMWPTAPTKLKRK